MMILSSLHSDAIEGIEQSWKETSGKAIDNLEKLSNLMSPGMHSFVELQHVKFQYREELQTLQSCTVRN
jgi:hypothetical protein